MLCMLDDDIVVLRMLDGGGGGSGPGVYGHALGVLIVPGAVFVSVVFVLGVVSVVYVSVVSVLVGDAGCIGEWCVSSNTAQ